MRTTKQKIEKFISEYETKIERCYDKIKAIKIDLDHSRKEYRRLTLKNRAAPSLEADLVNYKKQLAVQEKKKDILVQAKSDFECLL